MIPTLGYVVVPTPEPMPMQHRQISAQHIINAFFFSSSSRLGVETACRSATAIRGCCNGAFVSKVKPIKSLLVYLAEILVYSNKSSLPGTRTIVASGMVPSYGIDSLMLSCVFPCKTELNFRSTS